MVSIQYMSCVAKLISEDKKPPIAILRCLKGKIKMAFKDEEQAKAYWAENIWNHSVPYEGTAYGPQCMNTPNFMSLYQPGSGR